MTRVSVSSARHRALWRWHFYAGLIVLPFLAWLAVTGSLYLFKPEIERALYADWQRASATSALPPEDLIARVERSTGARVHDVLIQPEGESWRATIDDGSGRRTAFIDPATGAVLGSTPLGGVMETIKQLHSLAITGPVGNMLIEIVAGWAIILVVTGMILWWPRRRTGPGSREKWRRIHGWTGTVAGVVLVFLALTGLSWTQFWGGRMQTLIAATEGGRPRPEGVTPANHHAPAATHDDKLLPWSMQRAVVPMAGHGSAFGANHALAVAAARGIAAPLTIRLPDTQGQPITVSPAITRSVDARVLYLDPANGDVLLDARAGEFGFGARAFEWAITTHMGTQYGEANRIAMLAGCIGILLLAITGPILMWKRRRGIASPPVPDARTMRRVSAAMVALSIAFPMTGLTMLAALGAEALWRRLRPG